jgi:hypothetical protein
MLAEKSSSLTNLFGFKLKKEGRNYLPIVYNENYDISFWKLEKLHPFDTHKWSKVNKKLEKYFEVFRRMIY